MLEPLPWGLPLCSAVCALLRRLYPLDQVQGALEAPLPAELPVDVVAAAMRPLAENPDVPRSSRLALQLGATR